MPVAFTKDLVVLAADKSMQLALRGIVSRHESLRIRAVSFNVLLDIENDPGCYLNGPDFLRSQINRYARALLVLDRHGCGREQDSREELERRLESRLSESGWGDRAAAIVIDPELEVWVWTDSPHLTSALAWKEPRPPLRTWLRSKGFWAEGSLKPHAPQEALELVLRTTGKRRTSALFESLAQRTSLDRCSDPAFVKLKSTLKMWFPA